MMPRTNRTTADSTTTANRAVTHHGECAIAAEKPCTMSPSRDLRRAPAESVRPMMVTAVVGAQDSSNSGLGPRGELDRKADGTRHARFQVGP